MVLRYLFFMQLALGFTEVSIGFGPALAQQPGSADATSQVLFSYDRQAAADSVQPASGSEQPIDSPPDFNVQTSGSTPQTLPPAPLPGPVMHFDAEIAQASHEANQQVTAPSESRRLAPPSRSLATPTEPDDGIVRPTALPFKVPNMDSLGTAGAGLALVVGLFLLCVSLVRKTKPNASSLLPSDVVAVLGRVPLADRHFAHLIQVGTKLILVAVTPDSIQTITEVTEPAEVERLLTLCMKSSSRSTSAEFQKMLQQMSKDPARGFLGT
ncbi:flagellar biosynthetic protein FliO [Bythopirellula goksoeyrii]|uniref:Flagellar biosynthesis protein, FliO n=1 Tax=Bythopirellula goksoeyrii TaxID=1400387 RepID=A0A5B9Q6J9_9BACT|nr:flagellar biosynthetic protein FliO [Bythopirellula goksoeyrii]QEG33042.1 Flagellar biosynthesis protein, FliO [Bythopirellula goksoeyrii]